MLLAGLAMFFIPLVGAALSVAGWSTLRRRKAMTYDNPEEKRRRINEARTVLILGLVFFLPYPIIFAIVQFEKALFP